MRREEKKIRREEREEDKKRRERREEDKRVLGGNEIITKTKMTRERKQGFS